MGDHKIPQDVLGSSTYGLFIVHFPLLKDGDGMQGKDRPATAQSRSVLPLHALQALCISKDFHKPGQDDADFNPHIIKKMQELKFLRSSISV